MTKRNVIEDSLLRLTVLCFFGFVFSFAYAFQKDLQQNIHQTIEPVAITPVPSVALEQQPTLVNSDTLSITPQATTSTTTVIVAAATTAAKEPPVVIKKEVPAVTVPVKPKVVAKVIQSPVVGISPPTQTTTQEEEFAVKLASLIQEQTNEFRKRNNVNSLTSSSALESIATAYSAAMLAGDFFSHTDQNGCDLTCRFTAAPYNYFLLGENLAQLKFSKTPTAEEAAASFMKGWQMSAGHRKNLLSADFTYQGIGVAMSNDALYVTVDFSKPKP